MQDVHKQTVGLVGSGAVALAVARQLASFAHVVGFDPEGGGALRTAGVAQVDTLLALGARASIVFVAASQTGFDWGQLLSSTGLGAALPRGARVVTLTPFDPAQAQSQAQDLASLGIALVDAPIHCEQFGRFPEGAAILCGGAAESIAAVLPLLERLCPKVVQCGDIGAGHTARAIVGAVALCNRLVTYECAGMGFRNGLSVADMGTVLNRSSGANSATARVLPAIAAGERTADTLLADLAAEMAITSQLARRVGAPALIANQAFHQVVGASRTLGRDATPDDLRRLVETGSAFSFNP